MPGTLALDVNGLQKSYGDRRVLTGLDLRAVKGEVTAILGPNGAGKTTAVECCEGLRRPDGGHISVLGLDRRDPRHAQRLRERVGVMLQEGGLPQAPSAARVIRHIARLHARPRDPQALLARLGLGDVAHTRVRRLSGGQRQRLALGCAIVGHPELVFLDEPSSGLDPQSRLAVWQLLRELRTEGTSIVLTTHLMAEAETLADHVVIVDAGRTLAAGPPDELRGPLRIRVSAPELPDAHALAERLASSHRDVQRLGGASGAYLLVSHVEGHDLDAGAVADVARALDEIGSPGAEIALRRASLEDVFLDLTGHELRGETP
ncbi:MAG TPA: ABC transporter ATP-binding protein [Actinomycetaceae bacterium]|nr:ABC transporter ATP-binding protein [Actinomycetaceae bacterium]